MQLDSSIEPEKKIVTGPILMLFGSALALIGFYLLWQALTVGNVLRNEWTAEEKKQALTELIERAKNQGVTEPTYEEKIRALQGT